MATDPLSVGAAIAEIKARTGWTWAEVGAQLGTTGEYARKLATKPTSSGAGRSLAGNVEGYRRTGRAQPVVQREQRVRASGGQSAAPAARKPAASRRAFAGPQARDGWITTVVVPERSGEHQAANDEILTAVRSAARGRRRVSFEVVTREGVRLSVFGGHGAHTRADAWRGAGGAHGTAELLRNMRRAEDEEGNRGPLAWLVNNLAAIESYAIGKPLTIADIAEVDVIGLP